MSQAAFLTLNSFLESSNVSIKDDSSITLVSVEETDKSTTTSESVNSSSNDSIVKPSKSPFIKKSVDEVSEKLKILQTRLDFKLIIANISNNMEKSKNDSSNDNNDQRSLQNFKQIHDKSPTIPKPQQTQKSPTRYENCPCCVIDRQVRLSNQNCSISSCDNGLNVSPEVNSIKPTENHVWIGSLPIKEYKNPKYSNKVFLGGIPWDMTEQGLSTCFKRFGSCVFEWPGKDIESGRHPPKGYVYVLFENERSVKNLLFNCVNDLPDSQGEYFYRIETSKSQVKNVQVIPWVLSDSSHLTTSAERLDTSKTIFVGGLHGMMTAESIAMIFNKLFGGVVYVGIDTDKHKYPIGSGRITFSTYESYAKAIRAKFIEIKTPKFTKRIQIDPYLEDSLCSHCNSKQGPFFCREFICYRYFCSDCWNWVHSSGELKFHRPVTRQTRPNISVEFTQSAKQFPSP